MATGNDLSRFHLTVWSIESFSHVREGSAYSLRTDAGCSGRRLTRRILDNTYKIIVYFSEITLERDDDKTSCDTRLLVICCSTVVVDLCLRQQQ